MTANEPNIPSPRSTSGAIRLLAPGFFTSAALGVLLAGITSTASSAPFEPVHDPELNLVRLQRELPPPIAADPSAGRASGPAAGPACVFGFLPNARLHPSESGQHIWPDLAVGPGGILGAAWMDDHAAGGYHIFYSASTDGGVTWSTPEQVDTRGPGGYSKFVDLDFTPSGFPVAVWEDERFGDINVFLSARDPSAGGTPWTTNVQVNAAGSPPNGTRFMNPSLAVLDDERYFVAWTDWREGVFYQVYTRSTSDGGVTWGAETRVSDGLGFEPVAGDPCLIVDPTVFPLAGQETLYCVTNDWRGDTGLRYPNAYFYRSADGGATWTIGVQVNDIEPEFQQVSSHALVLLDDGTLTAGWYNSFAGPAEFRTSVSADAGATWGTSAMASSPGIAAPYSSIAAAENTVFALYGLFEVDWNVYFRFSTDGGRTWIVPPCRLDDDATRSQAHTGVLAARSPTSVAGVWQDNRPGGPWQIYTTTGTAISLGFDAPPPAPAPPLVFIESVSPNPAAGAARVRFETARPGAVLIRVLDVAGRAVRALRFGHMPAGSHAVDWDGRDASGERVASGAYWMEVDVDGRRVAESVLVVR